MGKNENRLLFLREFTKELIINSKKPEKLPQHPVMPELPPFAMTMPTLLQMSPTPVINMPKAQIRGTSEIKFQQLRKPLQIKKTIEIRQEKIQKTKSAFPLPPQNISPQILMPQPAQLIISPEAASIAPAPQPLPQGFSLGKLDPIIADKTVTSIECPGPEKLVLAKSLGRVTITRISLSEEEIKKVVNTFAEAARIPMIGGIFKAAVGNLVITAVISDFVGSRFIINKHTPYSIIDQSMQNQQFPVPSQVPMTYPYQNNFSD